MSFVSVLKQIVKLTLSDKSMKILWCWRCRMEVPMLEEEEGKKAYELYSAGFRTPSGRNGLQGVLKP
jgi:hypothetical protein